MILLNQAGQDQPQDICDSLELFAREVMPEFHAAEAEHVAWKQKVLAREIVLRESRHDAYDIFSHQNEHIVWLTPEQLKQRRWPRRKRSGRDHIGTVRHPARPMSGQEARGPHEEVPS